MLNSFTLENFERLELFSAWDSSIEERQRRDKSVHIPVAAIIEKFGLEFYGFYSINHPTLGMLHQYLSVVLRELGLPFHPANLATAKDPLIAQDVFPLHDFVAEYYGLPYRTSQHWMVFHLGKKYLTREGYITRCYVEYRKADVHKLKVYSPVDLLVSLGGDSKLKYLCEK